MKASGRRKNPKKKLADRSRCAGSCWLLAGANIYGSRNAAENAVPQVEVVKAVRSVMCSKQWKPAELL